VKLTEEDIRKLTLSTIQELGDNASPELVKSVVNKSVLKMESNSEFSGVSKNSGRIILTSFGINASGVVASITGTLADANCDIQDISQKIMGEYYTMILLFDISNSEKDLSSIQSEMNILAEKMNIKIYLQHEDIFNKMHRI